MLNAVLLIYNKLKGHRILWLAFIGVLLVFLFWKAMDISIEEDISKSFPENERIEAYKELFLTKSYSGKLILALEDTQGKQNQHVLIHALDSLYGKLRPLQDTLIRNIQHQIDEEEFLSVYNFVASKLPLFLSSQEVRDHLLNLSDSVLTEKMQSNLNLLLTPGAYALRDRILQDPLQLTPIALSRLEEVQGEQLFTVYEGYLFSKDLRTIFLVIEPELGPAESGQNKFLIQSIDQHIKTVEQDFSGVKGMYFGSVALSVENSRQIRSDIRVTATVAVVLIVLLVTLYYRKIVVPLMFLLPALGGGLFGLAMFAMIKGAISAISLGASSVILGIAIDYSFHFFTALKHNKGHVLNTLSEISRPLFLGCLTTTGAFMILLFLNSPVLRDFGLLAGLCLIGAALIVLLVLPHVVDMVGYKPGEQSNYNWLDKISRLTPMCPVHGLVIICSITIFLTAFIRDVEFDDDLNNLNYFPEYLKESQRKIFNQPTNDFKTVFVMVQAGSLQEGLEHNEQVLEVFKQLQRNGLIRAYSSISAFVPSNTTAIQRLQSWNLQETSAARKELISRVRNAAEEVGFDGKAFEEFYGLLNQKEFSPGDLDSLMMENAITRNFISVDGDKVSLINSMVVRQDLKSLAIEELDDMPYAAVLDQTSLANQMALLVREDFNMLLGLTASLVLMFLIIAYRRIELALMTFLPMVLSWVWILGLCGLFGIKFNMVNVVVTTFIFGLGDDYCLFVTEGILQRYNTGKRALSTFKSAILLSVITTIIGTGVLILAQHPALKSIALLSVIGMLSILVISFSLQPFLFDVFVNRREASGLLPLTLKSVLKACVAFLMFFMGCTILLGLRVLLPVLPMAKSMKKAFIMHAFHRFTSLIIFTFYGNRRVLLNDDRKIFDTPGIIVANHTSFIDILMLLSLHPKAVMMTNKWVWNSPFFGLTVRYADFLYTNDPTEMNLEKVRKNIEQGYSVIVFPEGTRSADGEVGRFHKGAFHFAKELNLNIYPLVLDGFQRSIQKGDFIVNPKQLVVKFLTPIPCSGHDSFGNNSLSKQLRKQYVEELTQLNEEYIDFRYMKFYLNRLYTYKNQITKGNLRKFLSQLDTLRDLFALISSKASKIVVFGCANGFLCHCLHLAKPKSEVLGLETEQGFFPIAGNSEEGDHKLEMRHVQRYEEFNSEEEVVCIVDQVPPKAKAELVQSLQRTSRGSMLIIVRNYNEVSNVLIPEDGWELSESQDALVIQKVVS